MRFDKERFESMKEQLPEWLLDESDSENRKQIDEFLLFGEVADEEYKIQKLILKVCKDEIIPEAPDGFFEQLPEQLWQTFQDEKSKENTQENGDLGYEGTIEETDSATPLQNKQQEKVVDFATAKAAKKKVKQAKSQTTNKAPLIGAFAMAASIVFAIVLWPTGSSVETQLHKDLQKFHQHLSINDDVIGSEIFSLEQQRMGFAPSGSPGEFVVWGRHLTLLYAMQQQGRTNGFTRRFDRLARTANVLLGPGIQGPSKNISETCNPSNRISVGNEWRRSDAGSLSAYKFAAK